MEIAGVLTATAEAAVYHGLAVVAVGWATARLVLCLLPEKALRLFMARPAALMVPTALADLGAVAAHTGTVAALVVAEAIQEAEGQTM